MLTLIKNKTKKILKATEMKILMAFEQISDECLNFMEYIFIFIPNNSKFIIFFPIHVDNIRKVLLF